MFNRPAYWISETVFRKYVREGTDDRKRTRKPAPRPGGGKTGNAHLADESVGKNGVPDAPVRIGLFGTVDERLENGTSTARRKKKRVPRFTVNG